MFIKSSFSNSVAHKLIALVFAVGLTGACSDDSGTTPLGGTVTCCDCTCSDGQDVCMNIVAEAELGADCDVVCQAECSAEEGCDIVDTAELCPVTTPKNCPMLIDDDEPDPDLPDGCKLPQ